MKGFVSAKQFLHLFFYGKCIKKERVKLRCRSSTVQRKVRQQACTTDDGVPAERGVGTWKSKVALGGEDPDKSCLRLPRPPPYRTTLVGILRFHCCCYVQARVSCWLAHVMLVGANSVQTRCLLTMCGVPVVIGVRLCVCRKTASKAPTFS